MLDLASSPKRPEKTHNLIPKSEVAETVLQSRSSSVNNRGSVLITSINIRATWPGPAARSSGSHRQHSALFQRLSLSLTLRPGHQSHTVTRKGNVVLLWNIQAFVGRLNCGQAHRGLVLLNFLTLVQKEECFVHLVLIHSCRELFLHFVFHVSTSNTTTETHRSKHSIHFSFRYNSDRINWILRDAWKENVKEGPLDLQLHETVCIFYFQVNTSNKTDNQKSKQQSILFQSQWQ